jgi:membrane-associated phospholipid phosphatase
MNNHSARRKIALTYCVLFALVALAYFFADRELATVLKPYTGGVKYFPWLTHIVDPLPLLATIGAAVAGARLLLRDSPGPIETAILRLCCAILIAIAAKEALKFAFGRTWPETWVNNNPSYFGTPSTYGFFPFHGGPGYASFPSGHTAVITAFAGALWFLCPKLRWLSIAAPLAVVIGLLGADHHWLSDIVAGGILGATTGIAAAKIGRQAPPGAAGEAGAAA